MEIEDEAIVATTVTARGSVGGPSFDVWVENI